jgi:Family of unknown function (DUF6510)
MEPLDGNAIGGLLGSVFGTDMTTAVGTCAACGASGQLAETVVYIQAPGAVMRCRRCANVLMVVVTRREVNCVDLPGLLTLTPAG